MSITPPSAYLDKVHRPYEENWLFKIFYDTDTSNATNCIALSYKDTTVDMFYYGAVLNLPSVRSSINLINSTSSSSGISLDVANFPYKNGLLSEEVLGGSRYYINHVVKVYSQLDGQSTLSNCYQIFEGRLVSISSTDNIVRFEVISKRPWDLINVPNTKTTSGKYIPVLFGEYTPNSVSTLGSVLHESTMTSSALHPMPFNQSDTGLSYYIDGISTNTSNAQVHIYEKAFDTFVACNESATSVASKDGSSLVSVDQALKRVVKYSPSSFAAGATDGNVTLSNAGNAIDNDDSNYANINYTETTSSSTTTEVTFLITFPKPSGTGDLKFEPLIDNDRAVVTDEDIDNSETGIDVTPLGSGVANNKVGVLIGDLIKINEQSSEIMRVDSISRGGSATLTVTRGYGESAKDTSSSGSPIYTSVTRNMADITIEIVVNTLTKLTGTDTFGSGKTVVAAELEGVPNSVVATTGDITSTGTKVSKGTVNRPMASNLDTFVLKCTFKCGATNISGGDVGATMNADIRIYEATKTSMRVNDNVADIVYSGSDGIRASESYTNGASSGAVITNIVDAHAQALNTYSGYDVSAANNIGTLRTARDGWNLRYWNLEPRSLKEILQQMQYEGAFIFTIRGDGTPNYIFIPNSTSASKTLSADDIVNVQLSHVSLDELVTKMNINYAKHPAEERHISSQVSTLASGTLPRTKWNIGSSENIVDINLDMLVANTGTAALSGNRNSGFAEYYHNILGDVKTKISFRLINPSFFLLEVGDLIGFDNDNMPVKLFASAWTDKVFIITSLSRRLGEINISAREV